MSSLRDSFQKAWHLRNQGKSGSAAQPTGDTGRQDDILNRVGFLEGHTKSSTKPVESYDRPSRATPSKKTDTPKPKGGSRRKRKKLPSPTAFDEDDTDFDVSQKTVESSKRVRLLP